MRNQWTIFLVVCLWGTVGLKPLLGEDFNRHDGQSFEDTENKEANRAQTLDKLKRLGINLPAAARMVKEMAEKNPASFQVNDFQAALEKVPGLTSEQKQGLLEEFQKLGGQEFFIATSNYLNEISATPQKGRGVNESEEKKAEEEKKKEEDAKKKFQETLLAALKKKEEKKQEGQAPEKKGEEGNKGGGSEKSGGEGKGKEGNSDGQAKDRKGEKDLKSLRDDLKKDLKDRGRGAKENTSTDKKDSGKDEKGKKDSNKDSIESLLKDLDKQKENDAKSKVNTEAKPKESPVNTPSPQPQSTVNKIMDLGPKTALQPIASSVGGGAFLNSGSSAGASAGSLGSAPVTPGTSPPPIASDFDLASMRFDEGGSDYAAPSSGVGQFVKSVSQFFIGNIYSEGGASGDAGNVSNESPEGEYAVETEPRGRNGYKVSQILTQPRFEKEGSKEFGIFSFKEEFIKKELLEDLLM